MTSDQTSTLLADLAVQLRLTNVVLGTTAEMLGDMKMPILSEHVREQIRENHAVIDRARAALRMEVCAR